MSSLSPHDRPRRRWLDARLAIGIMLIGASVAGVVALVAAADRTEPVLMAERPLVVGELVTEGDLVASQVRLGDDADAYLRPGDLPAEGAVLTRTVGAGELVPVTAVGDSGSEEWASVVVSVTGELPRAVTAGALVDLWAAPLRSAEESPGPEAIASGVTVVRVAHDEGVMGGVRTTGVELVVPRDRVAAVLRAKASEHSLSLVPASLPLDD